MELEIEGAVSWNMQGADYRPKGSKKVMKTSTFVIHNESGMYPFNLYGYWVDKTIWIKKQTEVKVKCKLEGVQKGGKFYVKLSLINILNAEGHQ